ALVNASASGAHAALVTSADVPVPLAPLVPPTNPYVVTVLQLLPDGFVNTASPTNPIKISDPDDPQSKGNNFLNYQQTTLSGTVFNDLNHNGRKDPGEPGVSEVSVLVTPPGQNTATLTTDASGFWQGRFDPRGTYQIKINAPDGASQTTPLHAIHAGGAAS